MPRLALQIDVDDKGTQKVTAFNKAVGESKKTIDSMGASARTGTTRISSFNAGLGEAVKQLIMFGSLKGVFIQMAAGLAIFTTIKNTFTGVIEKTKIQQFALAQLEAGLKSTGNAVGYTRDQLAKFAAGLQKTTTFGDEAIQGAQAILLTFTKIGHEAFPKATEAVLDLATAMGLVMLYPIVMQ